MSDIFRVFGTQFDPSVVQGLMRQERQRQASERNRSKRAAVSQRRKSTGKKRRQSNPAPERN